MASGYGLSYHHVAFLAASLLIKIHCYSRIHSLYSNIIAAKSTGFKYIVLPFHILGATWLVLQDLILPLLHLLPQS